MKEESEKVGLKLNIQKAKIMASGPISSWQLDGETVETVTDFTLGGSKMDVSLSELQELVMDREAWRAAIPGVAKSWTRLSDWTELKKTADGDCSHEIKRRFLLGRKVMTNVDSIKQQRHYFANKGPSSQGYGFSNSHIWMWELDANKS